MLSKVWFSILNVHCPFCPLSIVHCPLFIFPWQNCPLSYGDCSLSINKYPINPITKVQCQKFNVKYLMSIVQSVHCLLSIVYYPCKKYPLSNDDSYLPIGQCSINNMLDVQSLMLNTYCASSSVCPLSNVHVVHCPLSIYQVKNVHHPLAIIQGLVSWYCPSIVQCPLRKFNKRKCTHSDGGI